MSRNDERPRVNTFTASSVKRDSDEKLSYCEMYPHECAEIFDSDITNGLSIKQVKKQRKKYGYNIITAPVPLSFGESLKKQAKNLLVLFMFFSCIMMWIYERNNLYIIAASGVLTLIFINACLEHSAGKALNEKQKYSLPSVTVLRGGKQFVADSRSLVCGDVIFLEENRIVPADARLIECNSLFVLETQVSGVQLPVKKDARFLAKSKQKVCENMIYAGSIVTAGSASAVVCETGANVLINKNKKQKNQTNLPSVLKSMQKLGQIISVFSVIAQIIMVFAALIFKIKLTDTFILVLAIGALSMTDTAFAFSAIAVSHGLNYAFSKGALLRNLDSFSKLVSVNSVMCEKQTAFPPQKINADTVYPCFRSFPMTRINKNETEYLIKHMLLCSTLRRKLTDDKQKKKNENSEKYEGSVYSLALVKAAENMGITFEDVKKNFYRIESEFDSRGEVCRVLGLLDGKSVVILRGNPENVISRCAGYRENGVNCRFTEKSKQKALDFAEEISKTQTPIAVAVGFTSADSLRDITIERKLVLLGYVGFYAAIEISSASAVYKCNQAGIETVVSSSDSYYTASNLAKNAGIIDEDYRICTVEQMRSMNEGLFIANIDMYKVFLNLKDDEWLYILQLRRQNGRSTAVSASRIGQLPLMKEADATFVPRKGSNDTLLHSCDVQMINESFETIFETLKTARLVLKRIATTSEYLLVGFFTMIFWSIFSMSLGMGMPIRIQDAFVFGIVINLIYSFSLAFSPMNRNILTEPPPRVGTKFFTSSLITPILYSLISAILCIVSHKITINTFPESAITSSLVTYSLLLFFYTFMSGSKRSVLLNRAYSNYMALLTFSVSCVITGLIFYIPKAAAFFKYAPLSVLQLAVSIGLALMFFLTAQCVMMFIEMKKTKKERIK